MPEFTALWEGGPAFAQAEHFKLSTDCVLLADFVNSSGRKRGIDLGCASGAIALLLLWRSPRLHMTGLELVEEAAELARENMETNSLRDRSSIISPCEYYCSSYINIIPSCFCCQSCSAVAAGNAFRCYRQQTRTIRCAALSAGPADGGGPGFVGRPFHG